MLLILGACRENSGGSTAPVATESCSALGGSIQSSSQCTSNQTITGDSPIITPTVTPEPTATPTVTPSPTPREARAFPGIDRSYPVPNPLPEPAFIDGFKNTFYYLAIENDHPADEPKDQELLDMKGNLLAKVSLSFFKSIKLEGSGELSDGRVLNFAGRVNGETRYHVTTHFWGRAGGNCALKPFKSVAIDPTFVPQGSIVFIDETVGMKLPDGTLHDGVWYADDTGSAIQKARVDIFVGKREWSKSLAAAGIKHMQPLTIRVLRLPEASSCLNDPPK